MPHDVLAQDPTPPATDAARAPFVTPVVEEVGTLDSLTMELSGGGGT